VLPVASRHAPSCTRCCWPTAYVTRRRHRLGRGRMGARSEQALDVPPRQTQQSVMGIPTGLLIASTRSTVCSCAAAAENAAWQSSRTRCSSSRLRQRQGCRRSAVGCTRPCRRWAVAPAEEPPDRAGKVISVSGAGATNPPPPEDEARVTCRWLAARWAAVQS
jgi:hypothetical protein